MTRRTKLTIALDSELLKAIDKERGDILRSIYIQRILEARKLSNATKTELKLQRAGSNWVKERLYNDFMTEAREAARAIQLDAKSSKKRRAK
jgi:hypothetical protein